MIELLDSYTTEKRSSTAEQPTATALLSTAAAPHPAAAAVAVATAQLVLLQAVAAATAVQHGRVRLESGCSKEMLSRTGRSPCPV